MGERASTYGRKKWKVELHEGISTSGNEELRIRRISVKYNIFIISLEANSHQSENVRQEGDLNVFTTMRNCRYRFIYEV